MHCLFCYQSPKLRNNFPRLEIKRAHNNLMLVTQFIGLFSGFILRSFYTSLCPQFCRIVSITLSILDSNLFASNSFRKLFQLIYNTQNAYVCRYAFPFACSFVSLSICISLSLSIYRCFMDILSLFIFKSTLSCLL